MPRRRGFEDNDYDPGLTLKQIYLRQREVRFQCSMPMSHLKDDELRMKQKRDVQLKFELQEKGLGPFWGKRYTKSSNYMDDKRHDPTRGSITSKFVTLGVLQKVLLYLQSPSLMNCACVNKSWRALIENDSDLRRMLVEFIYTGTDYDSHGVLHYYGTLFGRREQWANPAKLIVCPLAVHASSVLRTVRGCDVNNIVHRGVADFATDSLPFSWVVVDFGENLSISPTYYTIGTSRHLTCYPSSWQLLGCTEPGTGSTIDMWRNWVLLDTVEPHEVRFSPSRLSQTFHVKHNAAQQRAYRYLRLVQTASNQQFGYSFVVSGLEFYGHLVKRDPNAPRKPRDDYWGV